MWLKAHAIVERASRWSVHTGGRHGLCQNRPQMHTATVVSGTGVRYPHRYSADQFKAFMDKLRSEMLHIGGAENARVGQWASTRLFCEEIGEKRSLKDSVNYLDGAEDCHGDGRSTLCCDLNSLERSCVGD